MEELLLGDTWQGVWYGKILTEKVQQTTNKKINEEQGRFKTGSGCIGQTCDV